jgi:hypothetical protein
MMIGTMGFLADVIQLGALHRRPIQRFLLSPWSAETSSFDTFLPLPVELVQFLDWWLVLQDSMISVYTSFKENSLENNEIRNAM